MEDTEVARHIRQSFGRYRFDRPIETLTARRRPTAFGLGWVGLATTVVTAVALWAINTTPLGTGPQLVLAGWTAVPTVSDTALAAAAAGPCGLSEPSLPAMTAIAQDQRGNAAALLYAGGSELSICVVARDTSGTVTAATSGISRVSGGSSMLTVDTTMSTPKGPTFPGLTVVAGRVGSEATGVEIAREDGLKVSATVASGYYVAWWPTPDKASTVVARDRGGKTVAELTVQD